MKQIIQSYKNGKLDLANVPVPLCKSGGVVVRNVNSLISIGTEKLMIDIAKKSLLGKATARPDLVKKCLDKAKKEGLVNVYKEAMNRLDEPVALGYSCAGIIIEVGNLINGFKVGDRVACVGAGFASHAEYVWVPENLCIKLPDEVSFESGSFCMLGGIAMQGIRLAQLSFGENVTVVGLGLLGLISVQMLSAYGCRVIGIDIDPQKVDMARKMGANLGLVTGKDDVNSSIENFTKGFGTDAVIITAATKDNSTLDLAENICRKKASIVLVGVADISLSRKNFWEKELSFTVSKAAGPGSIEPIYEQKNYDYPIEFVRWTQKRNLEQFIDLIAAGKVVLDDLITHRFKIDQALQAYEMITSGTQKCVGVMLEYPRNDSQGKANQKIIFSNKIRNKQGMNKLGLIGGGMFTRNILLPAMKKVKNISYKGVATTSGMTSSHIGKRYGFEYCTTNYKDLLSDANIDHIIITTRHDLHAKMIIEALEKKKNVYIEKPMCINYAQLRQVVRAYEIVKSSNLKFMIGFNRRFSPLAKKAKEAFKIRTAPLSMNYRINAGFIPIDHWTQDMKVGGGRIIGEVCHFIDFFQFICEANPVSVYAESISGDTGKYLQSDNVILNIKFSDGSVGSIIYVASGNKTASRERVEVFGEDTVLVIDDFKTASISKAGGAKNIKKMSQDMGYSEEMDYFFNAPEFNAAELFKGYLASTLVTIKAVESIIKKQRLDINIEELFVKENV